MWWWMWACVEPSSKVEPFWVEGDVIAVESIDGALPLTWITLSTGGGEQRFAVPGTNGPPAKVSDIPIFRTGESWRAQLMQADVGLTPVGLGAGLTPLGGQPRYALNGLHYPPEAMPREFYLHESGIPGADLADVEAETELALHRWTGVECATFEFFYAGTTDLPVADDGLNTLEWSDDWQFDPSIAGMTITRFDLEGEEPVPDESDILFNADTYDWSLETGDVYLASPLVHFGSVVTHELGHVTGMDHEMSLITSTMFYGYLGGDWMASLSGDDRRGLCANYPSGEDDCSGDEDCIGRFGEGWECIDLDGISVCNDVRDPVGADCSRTYINCTDSCVFTNGTATDGYCTVPCEDTTDCPDGFECGSPQDVVFPEIAGNICQPAPVDTDVPSDSPADADNAPEAPPDESPAACGCQSSAASWFLFVPSLWLFRRRARLESTS